MPTPPNMPAANISYLQSLLQQVTLVIPPTLIPMLKYPGPTNYQKLKLAAMDKYLDFWNLMAYDYSGSWDTLAGHNANWDPSTSNPGSTPFNTKQAINYYTANGVPASKIVLGMPLYGRGFSNTDGPGKPFSGVPQGSWEAGVYDYKALPLAGSTISTDNSITASWAYDSSSRILVSYDTPAIIRKKTDFIKSLGLGGGMWWESSGDRTDDRSLIKQVVDQFGGMNGGRVEVRANVLKYPQSKYDNLRDGFPNDSC